MQELLSFLPEENKTSIRRIFILLITTKVLVVILLILILFSGVLFGAQILLKKEIVRMHKEVDATKVLINGDENASLEEVISSLNQTTTHLSSIQSSYIVWSDVLTNIEELIVTGIHLNHLSIDSKASIAKMQGVADSRDDYFAFENALKNCPCVISAELPLSLLKTDIPFAVDIMLEKTTFLTE